MSRLDEIENKCGYKCCDCPYDDCLLDDVDGIEEELPVKEVVKAKKVPSKEKQREYRANFYRKYPNYHKEYYQKHKAQSTKSAREKYQNYSRANRRRCAKNNYDYITSMDIYDLAEFLSKYTGKKDSEIKAWLSRELIGGKLNG